MHKPGVRAPQYAIVDVISVSLNDNMAKVNSQQNNKMSQYSILLRYLARDQSIISLHKRLDHRSMIRFSGVLDLVVYDYVILLVRLCCINHSINEIHS